MTSKKSFGARIKQRLLVMRGPSAGAAVTSGKAVGREQECSATFRDAYAFSVPAQSDVYMKYCALEETCIFCPRDLPWAEARGHGCTFHMVWHSLQLHTSAPAWSSEA